MRIIVDAMGGDNCPEAAVLGTIDAVNKKTGFDIILVGDKYKIDDIMKKAGHGDTGRITTVHADQYIEMTDEPTEVFKTKREASMFKCCEMLKAGEGDVVVSSGNTGALLTAGRLIVGRIKNIDKPAMPAMLPTAKGTPVVVLDAGLNTLCKPVNYEQFAIMGSIYYSALTGKSEPSVGLVNIGTEECKGDDTVKQAHEKLSKLDCISFAGNIEGKDVPLGNIDVAVCDGFTGNVMIKSIEGAAKMFIGVLKNTFMTSVKTKLSYLGVKKEMEGVKKLMSSDEYAGAPLLGLKGIVIKTHGNSKASTFSNVILNRAAQLADTDIIERLEREMSERGFRLLK